jgi:glycosyltransferase involved in cell wall biosynthesis
MRISIAMTTYQGARFLPEQLESFAAQERLPDEVVVSDDGSIDRTLDIVRSFADRMPFEVRININEQRLGYARNFDRALSLCTGDIIFFSDQDDIWLPAKLKTVSEAFEEKGAANTVLIMNDAAITSSNGTETGKTKLGQTLALGLDERQFGTGCCMAIRKSFVPLVSPIPSIFQAHDTWINCLALALGSKQVLPVVLQLYRRHETNASAHLTSSSKTLSPADLFLAYHDKDQRIFCSRRREQISATAARIREFEASGFSDARWTAKLAYAKERLSDELQAVTSRIDLLGEPRYRRSLPALKALLSGHYRHFSGWKSFVKDLVKS